MAGSRLAGRDALYDLHRRWLTIELPRAGSLLTPGAAVWTDANLAELTEQFIDRPDLGSDDFLTKLEGQLRGVSAGAIQLMAELHVLHFLVIKPSAMSAPRKLSTIDSILSWMPEPPQVPADIEAVMGQGLVHPGLWVMTRRDLQLAWYIRFARAFRQDPDPVGTAGDPWRLRALTETISDDQAEGARFGLLHLSHPDVFEATVSPGHRLAIRDRFAALTDRPEDVDRAIGDIRVALARRFGDEFSFYSDPIRPLWRTRPSWRRFVRFVGRVRALPDHDREERDDKVALGAALAEVRTAVLADDPDALDRLRQVVRSERNNLTAWRTHERLLTWMQEQPDAARAALRELWTGPADGAVDGDDTDGEGTEGRAEDWPRTLAARIDRFLAGVPETVLPGPGARLNVTAFLLMADGVAQHPPLTASLRKGAWDLTHWGQGPAGMTTGTEYVRWTLFLDEVVRDGVAAGQPLRDRLDAQSAAWRLIRLNARPSDWTEQEWQDFLDFRGDPGSDDEDGEDEAEGAVGGRRPRAAAPIGQDDVARERADDLEDRLDAAAADLLVSRATVDELVELLEDKKQLILYGPPGTGKTFVAKRLAHALAGDLSGVVLVQFHPSTSYEDFVEGLRPRVRDGQVTYEVTSGPLVSIARAAEAEPDRTFVLVIDEINRANLPKVLGELLFLLEYRDEPVRLLYRPDEPFRLPANLRILATMNTADRSVALIDAAMRRRFSFKAFLPDEGPMEGILRRWLAARGGPVDVAEFLDAVNAELRERLGPHQAIGPSHFMRSDLSEPVLRRIWEANIFPLLEDQFWGDGQVEQWRWSEIRRRFRAELGSVIAEDGEDPDDPVGAAASA